MFLSMGDQATWQRTNAHITPANNPPNTPIRPCKHTHTLSHTLSHTRTQSPVAFAASRTPAWHTSIRVSLTQTLS